MSYQYSLTGNFTIDSTKLIDTNINKICIELEGYIGKDNFDYAVRDHFYDFNIHMYEHMSGSSISACDDYLDEIGKYFDKAYRLDYVYEEEPGIIVFGPSKEEVDDCYIEYFIKEIDDNLIKIKYKCGDDKIKFKNIIQKYLIDRI